MGTNVVITEKMQQPAKPEDAFLLLLDTDLQWELLQLVQQLNALLLHHTQMHVAGLQTAG